MREKIHDEEAVFRIKHPTVDRSLRLVGFLEHRGNHEVAHRSPGLRRELAGVSRDTLSRIERGEADPTLSVLEKLAAALGVSVPELFVRDLAEDDPDDAELARRAASGRKGNVGARALIAAVDEAAEYDKARYSRAGRPRVVR